MLIIAHWATYGQSSEHRRSFYKQQQESSVQKAAATHTVPSPNLFASGGLWGGRLGGRGRGSTNQKGRNIVQKISTLYK